VVAPEAMVDLRRSFGPARSQGPRPTCLAFAASAAHEHARRHPEALSPEALFRGCERRDPLASALGTTLAVALEAVEVDGQCNEMAWPYGDVDPSDHNATYYRARVDTQTRDDLIEVVRTTLATGQSVLMTLRLTDAWHTVSKDGNIAGPSANDQLLGGHAVVAVGHDSRRQRILIRNSWGTSWGDDGHAWLTEAYLRDYGFEVTTLEPLPALPAADL